METILLMLLGGIWVLLFSISQSLKKIAGRGNVELRLPTEFNSDHVHLVSQLGWEAGRGFEQGRRTDR